MTRNAGPAPWPVELQIDRAAKMMRVSFDDGAVFDLSAEYLRVSSPSAEVQGHGPSTRNIPGGKINVALTRADPVGNYAVRLSFDDGHSSGLFTWDYLYRLGAEKDELWAAYLAEITDKGLSRS